MMICSLCGQDHAGMSACPTSGFLQPTTIHIPGRTITTHEAMERCPVCHGQGYVAASMLEKFREVARDIGGFFKGIV